jgi:hypothetical protein
VTHPTKVFFDPTKKPLNNVCIAPSIHLVVHLIKCLKNESSYQFSHPFISPELRNHQYCEYKSKSVCAVFETGHKLPCVSSDMKEFGACVSGKSVKFIVIFPDTICTILAC